MPVSEILRILGYLLAILFLWRFLRSGQPRIYPYFAVFVFFMAVRLAGVSFIGDKLTIPFYNRVYWGTEDFVTIMKFAIVWEVLRKITHGSSVLRLLATALSVILLLALAAAFLWMGPRGDVFSDLERKLSLAVAAWLLLVLTLAIFYGVKPSRPVWAMSIGLGIVASISLANFSALGLSREFVYWWGLIRQSSFSMVMAIWLWGFWGSPRSSELPAPGPHGDMLAQWKTLWSRLRAQSRQPFGVD